MAFSVLLTHAAAEDMESLYDYIATSDAPEKANRWLDQIEKTVESLKENPERGRYPKELLEIGLKEYREIYFKPYRIIYRIMDKKVFIMLITDGRRDMQTLLERRLLSM